MIVGVELIDSTTYRLAAAIICITCLFYSIMMRRTSRIRSRLFFMLLTFTLIDCVTEPFSFLIVSLPVPDFVKWIVSYSCQMVYYFTHFAIIPIFVFYIIVICGIRFKFSYFQKSLIKVPFYFLELMLLTNPFTQFTFYIKGKFEYARGTGVYIAYALSCLYFAYGLFLFIKYWGTINSMKRVAMIYFMALAVTGTLVQMIFPDIKCELLCEAIGLSGIMIMIEKDDDRIESSSGAFNRNAFLQDVNSFFRLKREFKAVCIRISNIEMYRKVLGYDGLEQLFRQISTYLMNYDQDNYAYHTNIDVFYMLVTDKNRHEIESLVGDLSRKFENDWEIGEDKVRLDVIILVAECPQQFANIDDIFLMDATSLKEIDKNILMGSDIEFLLRRIEVEKAIGRGIANKNFKLMYIPVYKKENLMIKLSHAILRLYDDELGEIKPKEFMQVAESSGFIEEMQFRTFEGVCRFLGSGVDRSDMQMDFVLVPIMSASMIRSEFVKKVKETISRFEIDPSLVAFVMKENYAFYAKDALNNVMEAFTDYGIRFYISDYEAGFLGLNTLSGCDFEGVIIDIKSIYDAEHIENADIILANRVNMIKQLGKTVILSGIDSRKYYDRIINVPFDYAEGEYFSGDISKNELQNKFWHGEHLVITDYGIERLQEDESM